MTKENIMLIAGTLLVIGVTLFTKLIIAGHFHEYVPLQKFSTIIMVSTGLITSIAMIVAGIALTIMQPVTTSPEPDTPDAQVTEFSSGTVHFKNGPEPDTARYVINEETGRVYLFYRYGNTGGIAPTYNSDGNQMMEQDLTEASDDK